MKLFHRVPLNTAYANARYPTGITLERSGGTTWGVHLVLAVRGTRTGTYLYNFGTLTATGRIRYWCRISWRAPAWYRRASSLAVPRFGAVECRAGHYFHG